MVVGGLFDAENAFGAQNLYKAIEAKAKNNNRVVLGPWFHGQWGGRGDGSYLGNVQFGTRTSEWYQNNVELPFFNYHLKGKGTQPVEATVFFTGENEWKQLPQWPPASTTMKAIYLQASGALSWTKPAAANSFSSYISDPANPVPYAEDVHLRRTREYMTDDQRFASRRPDVMEFETEILTEDLTLAGPVYANLLASISTTDADFVVKLIDVFPDSFAYSIKHPLGTTYPMAGYQMLVRAEVMRGRFRNSFEKPEPFTPGKVEQIRYTIPDVAHTFKKGHWLMIQIQSSWFPLVDRNPQKFVNIYEATEADFQKAEIRVFHDAKNASFIELPVLRR
jgi:putative CocE/NonD family hydrolase